MKREDKDRKNKAMAEEQRHRDQDAAREEKRETEREERRAERIQERAHQRTMETERNEERAQQRALETAKEAKREQERDEDRKQHKQRGQDMFDHQLQTAKDSQTDARSALQLKQSLEMYDRQADHQKNMYKIGHQPAASDEFTPAMERSPFWKEKQGNRLT
jgi:membrane-associated HD superfamily phosphohydrolase